MRRACGRRARTARSAAPRPRAAAARRGCVARTTASPPSARTVSAPRRAAVADGVLHQVADQALEQRRVAAHDRGRRARRRSRCGPERAAAPTRGEVDAARRAGRRAWRGEHEQAVEQRLRALGALDRAAQRLAQLLARRRRGRSSATSASVRMTVSGVRSSWLALATKRCWASMVAARRSSIASKRVGELGAARRAGRSRPTRASSRSSEIRRAVRAIARSGASALAGRRPAERRAPAAPSPATASAYCAAEPRRARASAYGARAACARGGARSSHQLTREHGRRADDHEHARRRSACRRARRIVITPGSPAPGTVCDDAPARRACAAAS